MKSSYPWARYLTCSSRPRKLASEGNSRDTASLGVTHCYAAQFASTLSRARQSATQLVRAAL